MEQKAEAEPFAPKKENLAPLPDLALPEPFSGFQGGAKGLGTSRPGRTHRADSGHPGLTEERPPSAPFGVPSEGSAFESPCGLRQPQAVPTDPKESLAVPQCMGRLTTFPPAHEGVASVGYGSVSQRFPDDVARTRPSETYPGVT